MSNVVNLSKGERINLVKTAPGLRRVMLGLGWDSNTFDTGGDFDLDVVAFALNEQQKCPGAEGMCFYNQPTVMNGAIVYSGDCRKGEIAGDDETMTIDLEKLPASIAEVSVVVSIFEAATRRQNFGMVKKSYIRLVDADSGQEIARYDLEDEFSAETSVQFGSLARKDGGWRFAAVGAGYKRGLGDFCQAYGLQVG